MYVSIAATPPVQWALVSQQKKRNTWKMETQEGVGWNNSEGYLWLFKLSLPVTFFVLLLLGTFSCSFETHRSAQHQTTRPHGHVPAITTSLYYKKSKKFIAPPHLDHYLCPPCFQKRVGGKDYQCRKYSSSRKYRRELELRQSLLDIFACCELASSWNFRW